MIVVNQTSKLLVSPDFGAECIFWWLVCYAATQLALQLQQERLQVVRSNEVVRGLLVTVPGIACIWVVGCAYPGFAPYILRLRYPKVRCVHMTKSPLWLCASVAKKTLAYICQNGLCGCAHWCPKRPLRASVSEMTLACIRFSESLKPNVWIQKSETLELTFGILQQP